MNRRNEDSLRLQSQKLSINVLNSLPVHEFVARVGPVFEHSPWIAEATAGRRPFPNLSALHRALCQTMLDSGIERKLALIRAHPDLVGKAALAGTLTAQSTAEQASAGLNQLSAGEIATFQQLNDAYKSRFGFPFVICARENKKPAILHGLQTRVHNTQDAEIKTALEEIAKIAYLRLQDIVHD